MSKSALAAHQRLPHYGTARQSRVASFTRCDDILYPAECNRRSGAIMGNLHTRGQGLRRGHRRREVTKRLGFLEVFILLRLRRSHSSISGDSLTSLFEWQVWRNPPKSGSFRLSDRRSHSILFYEDPLTLLPTAPLLHLQQLHK